MNTLMEKVTQEARVLSVLKEARGEWVGKRYLVHEMLLSQAGRALHNLQHNLEWKKQYAGYELESSREYKLKDKFGFYYWRLRAKDTLF